MRVLLVNGSHRRGGFTSELSELFAAGCEDAGATVDRVDLLDYRIDHCLGCYGCYTARHPGRCVQNDDMGGLIDRFYQADGIVLASPVYFYSFSARIKQFVERLFPVSKPSPEVNPTDGLVHHAPRDPKRGPQIAALIAVMAHRNPDGIAGLYDTFARMAFGIGARPVGKLVRAESPFIDFESSKPRTIRRIRSAFRHAGAAFVEGGTIPDKWQEQANLPLTLDTGRFYSHFRTYWEILEETGTRGGDRAAVREVTTEDLRILMPELADSFDPLAAPELEAVIQFEISGDSSKKWHLIIDRGRCEVREGSFDSPDLTIGTSSKTLVEMILQKLDVRRALAKKDIELGGDTRLFLRFGRLFPPRNK